MAKDQKINMPGVFGGLMRYDSEYKSKFMLSPKAVVGYIIAVLAIAILVRIFFPI